MKTEFITRTFTTTKTTLSAVGKKELVVDTTDIKAAVKIYAQVNGVKENEVNVITKEEKTLYKMSVEKFLEHAEVVNKK